MFRRLMVVNGTLGNWGVTMKMPHTSRTISYARRAKAEILIFTIDNLIFFPFELS